LESRNEPAQPLPPEICAAAGRSWRLFPVKAKEKLPLVKGWPEAATSDIAQLEVWAHHYPACNWGLATGTASGLFVVDLDGDTGLGWLKARIDDGLDWPESWAVKTARGFHCYFEWPAGKTIRNSAGKLAAGVDIRGQNGYVLVPPSTHPTGTRYQTVNESCPVVPAPAWLLAVLLEPPAKSPKMKVEPKFNCLPEGQRNDGLTRLGGYLRRKGESQTEIEAALQDANICRCIPPLPESEVSGIAASVARYEPGGPDSLEQAWESLQATGMPKGYSGFLQLAKALQNARQSQKIALPLVRIGELFGVHYTAVAQWRKRAVATGLLEPADQYIPHRRAGTYLFREGL
jgi:putative DNA primase/helicase